ncbi:hypothetical protein ACHAWX_000162 [Stephanocyclus meneghinianus]
MQQSLKYFFEYLAKHLQKQGLCQSDFNPCLFNGKIVITITWIGDLLFYACDDNHINLLLVALKADDICIHCKGAAEGFLSGDISHTYASPGLKPTLILTQKGLNACIIETRHPCQNVTFEQEVNGVPTLGSFNYAMVIGIFLYLSCHSRPDIAFTVHQEGLDIPLLLLHLTRNHSNALADT